jgi:hypothetical protein
MPLGIAPLSSVVCDGAMPSGIGPYSLQRSDISGYARWKQAEAPRTGGRSKVAAPDIGGAGRTSEFSYSCWLV